MLNLPPVLIIETLKISSIHPWLFLLDIVLPNGTPIYLVHNTEDIVFQGRTYQKFSFQIELPSTKAKGAIPNWTLRIGNALGALEYYLDQFKGMNGSQVTIRIVNAGYLSKDHSELETELIVLASDSGAEWVTFTLGGPNYLLQNWLYRYLADSCPWKSRFKRSDNIECGYTGPATTCDGTLTTCRSYGMSRRYGGSPGLANNSERIA
ncbi:MAG: hypothetical protein M1510_10665 [Nitrospirae bacterium]|nr:hypothetical protein [Nitrospirota bacterium]MCL5237403.1 hypothetical protein [Nitrospirota bacterium]